MNNCLDCMGIFETNFDKNKLIKKINSMTTDQAGNFAKFTSSVLAIKTLLEVDKYNYLKQYILDNQNITDEIIIRLAKDSDKTIKNKALMKTSIGCIGKYSDYSTIIGALAKESKINYLELMIDLLETNASGCCEIAINSIVAKDNVCLIKLYANQGCSSARESIRVLKEDVLLKIFKEHPEIKFHHGVPSGWPDSVIYFLKSSSRG